MTPITEATFSLPDGSQHQARRASPEESWEVDVACPVCGLEPLRCRGYDDEVRRRDGRLVWPAWCRGRHDRPIGELSIPEPPGELLLFMGVVPDRFIRARIYGGGA